MGNQFRSDGAASEAHEDEELIVVAARRMSAVLDGTDRLVPLEEVMREYGLTPAYEAGDTDRARQGSREEARRPAPSPGD